MGFVLFLVRIGGRDIKPPRMWGMERRGTSVSGAGVVLATRHRPWLKTGDGGDTHIRPQSVSFWGSET